MKILLNATNLVVGGGIQVAASFIFEAVRRKEADHEWLFCVSAQVAGTLRKILREEEMPLLEVFERNPNHLLAGRASRKRLRELAESFKADIIFTVFGPFLMRFVGQRTSQPTAHLAGCAVGWSTHPNRLVYEKIGCLQTLKRKIRRLWDFFCLRRAQYFWIESDIAREGLKHGTRTDDAHIRTIRNTCAGVFQNADKPEVDFSEREIRLLVMGNPYVHKNFDIVPDVLVALKKRDAARKYIFTLTAPENSEAWRSIRARAEALGMADGVRTVGKVILADCPKLYSDCHVVFMPTLLETFSATYPEAMAMRRPIVTTDLNFAHDICGNAAAYYSPTSAEDAAEKIIRVVKDFAFREQLLADGKRMLDSLPTPQEKYEQLVSYMREIFQRNKKKS